MDTCLTALALPLYIDGASTKRGCLRPPQRCGKEVFSFYGQLRPECLHVARHGAASFWAVATLRAIFMPETARTKRRFTMDTLDLVDMLNVCCAKIAFISDVFTQESTDTFHLSPSGQDGFAFIMSDLESDVEFVSMELYARRPGKVDENTTEVQE